MLTCHLYHVIQIQISFLGSPRSSRNTGCTRNERTFGRICKQLFNSFLVPLQSCSSHLEIIMVRKIWLQERILHALLPLQWEADLILYCIGTDRYRYLSFQTLSSCACVNNFYSFHVLICISSLQGSPGIPGPQGAVGPKVCHVQLIYPYIYICMQKTAKTLFCFCPVLNFVPSQLPS